SIIVNFNDSNLVFNDDMDLEEEIEFAKKPKILDIETEKKI
ncbi:26283_t:CDS:1, partial [Dentiscutata erythropus]